MFNLKSIAFALYAVALTPGFILGTVYLFRSRFMAYHEAAFGKSWEELERRTQVLMLAAMKLAGVGMLACAVGGGVLLWGPYRTGVSWANSAVFGVLMCEGVPAVVATLVIHRNTGAATPRVPAVVVVGLGLVAFALAQAG
jgi:hypothetical protein